MVKRRAPKRDPSLHLIKPNGSMIDGSPVVPHNAGTSAGSSGAYDAELPMKMKIRDLENEISSLETTKRKTVSEIHGDESEMLSIHKKIELLQVQKQKLQQSRREKEGQLDVYSSKIEKLTSQKKHLEVALDIVRGRA
jgi:chromosome segregation ATPase